MQDWHWWRSNYSIAFKITLRLFSQMKHKTPLCTSNTTKLDFIKNKIKKKQPHIVTSIPNMALPCMMLPLGRRWWRGAGSRGRIACFSLCWRAACAAASQRQRQPVDAADTSARHHNPNDRHKLTCSNLYQFYNRFQINTTFLWDYVIF